MDAVISIAGRPVAPYAGSRLSLPSAKVVSLANGAQIAGGIIILDGTSRSIVVLALASGRVVKSIEAPPGSVRIAAPRRGGGRSGLIGVHMVNVELGAELSHDHSEQGSSAR